MCVSFGVECVELLHPDNSEWDFKIILYSVTTSQLRKCHFNYQNLSHTKEWQYKVLFSLISSQEGYLLHPSSLWENYPHVHHRYDCVTMYKSNFCINIYIKKCNSFKAGQYGNKNMSVFVICFRSIHIYSFIHRTILGFGGPLSLRCKITNCVKMHSL